MHEYSIVQALSDRVRAEMDAHGAVAVHGISVRIGELSGVDPELLASAYDLLREGTPWAGAPLKVERTAAVWECPSCRTELARGGVLRCASCGGPARLRQGDEILLDRIEMEVPDVRRVRL